jgi:hypothetical protein
VNRLVYSETHWVDCVSNRLQHWVKDILSTLGVLHSKLISTLGYQYKNKLGKI